MNALPAREPVVGAVDGGVGTTTVATMIGAYDAGVIADDGSQLVDVLVARSTAASVRAAVATAAAMPVRPVLVVVAHSSDRWSPPVEQRLRMVEPNVPAVVRMGWIGYLAACDDPWTSLVEGIWAQYPPKWAAPARQVRERLVAAVTPLVLQPHDHSGHVPSQAPETPGPDESLPRRAS